MSKFLKYAATCAASLMMIAATPQTSFATDSLEIRNFVGTLHWSNGPMSTEIKKNAGETEISGRQSVVIDGGREDIGGPDCQSAYGRYDINWFGKKKQGDFGDLPVLEIALPEDTHLVVRNSIIFTTGAPNIGSADLALRYCGEVTLGDIEGQLALDNRGSADVTAGAMGQFVANLKGSGDFTGGDSGEVLIESRGSADVEIGHIASLELSIFGSGDVEAKDIEGSADLSSRGSGDIDLGAIDGLLTYSGFGSGDLEVGSVQGETAYLLSKGSGDIQVNGGDVQDLIAATQGSARIDFLGEAGSANLKSSGSGDIHVKRVTGPVEMKTQGSGDIQIDERN